MLNNKLSLNVEQIYSNSESINLSLNISQKENVLQLKVQPLQLNFFFSVSIMPISSNRNLISHLNSLQSSVIIVHFPFSNLTKRWACTPDIFVAYLFDTSNPSTGNTTDLIFQYFLEWTKILFILRCNWKAQPMHTSYHDYFRLAITIIGFPCFVTSFSLPEPELWAPPSPQLTELYLCISWTYQYVNFFTLISFIN